MKEFKYSIYSIVKSVIISTLTTISCIALVLTAQLFEMPYSGFMLISGILIGVVAAKYEGSSHRKSVIMIDDEKIHLYRNRSGTITDRTIRFNEIIAIRKESNINLLGIMVKRIFIITEYQKVDLDINCYENYRILLEIIVNRTKANHNFVIDKEVMELM